jgi:hypothetical protein
MVCSRTQASNFVCLLRQCMYIVQNYNFTINLYYWWIRIVVLFIVTYYEQRIVVLIHLQLMFGKCFVSISTSRPNESNLNCIWLRDQWAHDLQTGGLVELTVNSSVQETCHLFTHLSAECRNLPKQSCLLSPTLIQVSLVQKGSLYNFSIMDSCVVIAWNVFTFSRP